MVKTVMVVDDDPDIVVSVKAVLEAARYRVICADSGVKGVLSCWRTIKFLILFCWML